MNAFADGTFRVETVLSKSFSLLRRNILPFTALAGSACALELLIPAMGEAAPPATDPGVWLWALLPNAIVNATTSTLSTAVILYLVLHQLIERPVRIGQAIAATILRLPPLFGIALLSILSLFGAPLIIFTLLPFMLVLSNAGDFVLALILFTPGLILMTLWYVAIPVCLMERRGPFQSVSRSDALMKGARAKLLMFVILELALGYISDMLADAVGSIAGYWGQTIVQFALFSLHYAFTGVLTAVIYYELLVEKQGFDAGRIVAAFD